MKTVQTRVTTRSRKVNVDNNRREIDKSVVKSNAKNAKVVKKRTRRALADRTNSNSGSDLNSSSPSKKVLKSGANVCPASENRPKRTRQVPSRFQDHLLSPASRKKGGSFTSTPLSSSLSANRKSQITCKLSPIVEPASDSSYEKSKDVRSNISPKKKNTESSKMKPPSSNKNSTNSKLVKKNGTSSARVLRNSNSKTQRKTSIDKVLVFDKTTNSVQNASSMQSPKNQVPVYKKNIIGDDMRTDNKSMLYEFEFDPTNEPKVVKKKKILKNKKPNSEIKNPIKKKKKMSRKSADLAMQNLIENLKKIQAEKMMKKLVAKIKPKESRNIENNISTNSQSAPNEVLSETNTAQPVQPIPSHNSNDDFPPSPLNSEDIHHSDIVHESNPPNVSTSYNESLRFSNHPIANSSAIVNERPNCSPWRMNLDSDVKKWRYNFPVKPSMTPAYERDTFHVLGLDDKVEDSNAKTANFNNKASNNVIVSSTPIKTSEHNENTKKLLQTSILSFYADSFKKSPQKRVAAKNKSKKFNFDAYSSSFNFNDEKEYEAKNNSAEKQTENVEPVIENVEPAIEDVEPAIENVEPAIENCFGFDDNSEEIDQENLSPVNKKASPVKRSQRIKKNVASILKEINDRENRVTVQKKQPPIVRKERSPEKSPIMEESLIFSQENISEDNTTNVNSTIEENPEKECPLFEDPVDVEVVHYNKPTRRSYGRSRKPPVRFQNTVLNDEVEDEVVSDAESVESVKYVVSAKTFKKRKAKKIPQFSKKEEKEVAEWAAGFNSMLEEVEEFPLCVE